MKRFPSVEKEDVGRITSEAIVEGQVQYDDRGYSVLHAAASKGWIAGVRYIIDNRILDVNILDSNESNQTPLYIASFHGRADVVRLLLSGGADANVADDPYAVTPLHVASRHGFAEVAASLLDGGANLEARDNDRKSTPLLLAADQSKMAVVKLLIDRGADVSAKDTFDHSYQDLLARNERNPAMRKR